ncbi:MAG: matrixin family metalloprotease [Bacteriovorax sp.]
MKALLKLLLPSLFALSAQAFTLNNSATLTFGKNEVLVNVAAGNCSNIGIDENELLSIVGDAVDQYWNRAPTSRLKLRQGKVVSVASAFKTDTICLPSTSCDPNPALAVSSDVLITCNHNATNFSSPGVLAVTVPNNIDGKTILGSLIMINDLASNQLKFKSRDEKISIIAHEIGHTFGLGHSPVTDSLMYYATVNMRKSLGSDDIDGITYLYPKQQPVSCGSVDQSGTKNSPNTWLGLLFGFLIIALINFQLRYLKLRPRF